MIADHLEYKKGQIVELEEKQAITLLTNGKALKIHRKTNTSAEKTEENSEEKTQEKGNKKSKKNDQ